MGQNINSRTERASSFSGFFFYIGNTLSEWKITFDNLLIEILSNIPVEVNTSRMHLSSGFVTSQEMRFSELTNFASIGFTSSEIDSLIFETRQPNGTYTTRADLSALNAYANSTSDFYLKVSATFDVAYFGQSDVVIKSSIYTP